MFKSIINFAIGAGVGGVIGWIWIKDKFEREWEARVEEIYADAAEEGKREIQKIMDDGDEHLHRHIVEEYYTKPDLNELLQEKLAENFAKEETTMEEDKNISVDDYEEGESGIITEHDFQNSCPNYAKNDIFYYAKDGVFTDDDDQEIFIDEEFEMHKMDILVQLKEHSKVYFRNAEIQTDFEVHRLNLAFNETQYETPIERERRIGKMKLSDDF